MVQVGWWGVSVGNASLSIFSGSAVLYIKQAWVSVTTTTRVVVVELPRVLQPTTGARDDQISKQTQTHV